MNECVRENVRVRICRTDHYNRNHRYWRWTNWLISNPQRREFQTKAARNKAIKSKVKTYVKKVETAVEKKDAATAAAALKEAIAEINKAGSKGVYHKNTCSRKISRLTKAVNGIA